MGDIQGLCRGYVGIIEGLCRAYIGILCEFYGF